MSVGVKIINFFLVKYFNYYFASADVQL